MVSQVAQTIFQQLGANRFKAMTGASSFAAGPETLSFRIPQTKGIRAVVVKLLPSDTYSMEFFGIRGLNCRKVAEFTGVYCDQLQAIFSQATGLATRL